MGCKITKGSFHHYPPPSLRRLCLVSTSRAYLCMCIMGSSSPGWYDIPSTYIISPSKQGHHLFKEEVFAVANLIQGIKGLIDKCFVHINDNDIRSHALAGHYDLITTSSFSTGLEAFPQAVGTPAASPVAVDSSAAAPSVSTVGSTSTTLPSPAAPPTVPSPPTTSAADPEPNSRIILPEVWEDMVEPGSELLILLALPLDPFLTPLTPYCCLAARTFPPCQPHFNEFSKSQESIYTN